MRPIDRYFGEYGAFHRDPRNEATHALGIPMIVLAIVMWLANVPLGQIGGVPIDLAWVMIATVAVTVATHDLAQGVLVGVLASGFFFAHKVGRILNMRSAAEDEGRVRRYTVSGQVFFASADAFVAGFDFKEVIDKVVIDVSRAHFWDITAVSALDKAVVKFRREGTEVEVVGLNEASATMVDKFAVHDKDGADDLLMGH